MIQTFWAFKCQAGHLWAAGATCALSADGSALFYMYFLSLYFIVVHSSSLIHSFSFLNIFPDENLPEAFYVLIDVLLSFALSFISLLCK